MLDVGLEQRNFQCNGGVRVYALRIRKVIDSFLLGEEGSYMPDTDAGVEAELADDCN